MTTDRPLHLDVGVPSGSNWSQSHTGTQGEPHTRQGLQQDSVRLKDLLLQPNLPPSHADQAPSPLSSHTNQTKPASHSEAKNPFELFRPPETAQATSVAAASTAAALEPAAEPDTLLENMLQHMASRLLVNDGHSGRRAVQLQIEDAQLPGVELQVFEAEGRLTALFTCASENSRLKLCKQATWLAEQLAQKLQRATCVQVQTDDPSAPCLEQAVCDAF